MTDAVTITQESRTRGLGRSLVGLGVICGALVAFAYLTTQPIIEAKRLRALEAGVFALWPGARSTQAFEARGPAGVRAVQATRPSDDIVHAVYDDNGRLLGMAIVATGMGYQDRIQLIYGYDPRRQAISGMRVLESRETPGLGERIEYDATFLRNFANLPVFIDAVASASMRLEAVKAGSKHAPWQIDSISGATVSSHAVVGIMNRSIERWLARLHGNMEVLEGGAKAR